jgi:flagellar biosynthetic protein FliR
MFELLEGRLLLYGLVLVRVTALLFALPLWSGRFPVTWKAGAALWMAVLFSFCLPEPVLPEDVSLRVLVSGLSREILAGAAMGFGVRLLLAAITLGGQLVGFQMGLGIANVMDPATSDQNSVISQWLNLLALFLFLEADGHLIAVEAVAKSFAVVPPLFAQVRPSLFLDLVRTGGMDLFRASLELAWPVSLALLLVYLALGLLARLAPQMNMLMLGFPITILVGALVLLLAARPMGTRLEEYFQEAFVSMNQVLAALGR